MAVALMSAMQVNAQEKISEKALVGAWMMDSMIYDNGNIIVWGLKRGYRQFKYYGPNGEYAAAGISITKTSSGTVKYIVDCCKKDTIPTNVEQDVLKEMFSK